MKKTTTLFMILGLIILGLNKTKAQTLSEKQSVEITISSFDANQVTFTWDNFSISSTSIYRKEITHNSWTSIASNISAVTYTDSTILSGIEYEYKFEVNTGSTPATAYGYIAFGIDIAKKDSRGDLLILVDNRFEQNLANELFETQLDALSDGWNPTMVFVDKDSSVQHIKSIIDNHNSSVGTEAVYLIGHIPVPYSGAIKPDGHFDHTGAWPTDLYYVTNASLGTDVTDNLTNPYRPMQTNLRYDGKFDNGYLPEATFAAISRIDFYNLPASNSTELEMMEDYLKAATAYKRGTVIIENEAIIDNQIPNVGEGFASNAFTNFPSLVGDSITEGALLSNLPNKNYKWIFAAGYSSDTSMGGVGSISDFHNEDYTAAFGMTFGSYFGDWNTENNLMRSMMANGKLLANCWAGRPNWFFHHMGLNNPIALSSQMSQNNKGMRNDISTTRYDYTGFSQNGVHMALLGDLTLRNNYKPVVQNFLASSNTSGSMINLSWSIPSGQNIIGFEVYQSNDSLSSYSLLASLSATTTNYTDSSISSANYYYIKYLTLDTTTSGSYINNSLGTFISVAISNGIATGNPLPVELVNFTAKLKDTDGHLTWTTAQEENFSHFELERSINGIDWAQIA